MIRIHLNLLSKTFLPDTVPVCDERSELQEGYDDENVVAEELRACCSSP
jgi:hypothetical protein